jgi:hypothetical protein
MSIEIPIYERSRKYGYVYWKKNMDNKIHSFLGNRRVVDVWLDNSYLGEKNVDLDHRRISLGYSRTRKLAQTVKKFKLKFDKEGNLKIACI